MGTPIITIGGCPAVDHLKPNICPMLNNQLRIIAVSGIHYSTFDRLVQFYRNLILVQFPTS